MKKLYRAAVVMWMALVLLPAAGFSGMIQGEVAAVDPAAGTVVIVRSDPETGAGEAEGIQTIVSSSTKLAGIGSLMDLRVGDEVRAEVEAEPEQGLWKVQSLALDKVKIQDVKLPGEAKSQVKEPVF